MSDSSSDSSSDGGSFDFNFRALYDKKFKEINENIANGTFRRYIEKPADTNKQSTDTKEPIFIDLVSSNTNTFANREVQPVDLEPSNIIDLVDLEAASTSTAVSTSRGRKRKSNTKDLPPNAKIIGPTICIGDFDDGYNIPPPPKKQTIVEDDEDTKSAKLRMQRDKELQDEFLIKKLNREMPIKVHWLKSSFHSFPLRKFQTLKSIYEDLAKFERIKVSEVLLRHNGKRLSPMDTPHIIDYKYGTLITGEIEYYKSIYEKSDTEEEPDDLVTFRVKQKDKRHPLLVTIKRSEPMAVLYLKLSEELGLDLKSFTLEFDGDKIELSATMESLELDGDECLELHEKTNK